MTLLLALRGETKEVRCRSTETVGTLVQRAREEVGLGGMWEVVCAAAGGGVLFAVPEPTAAAAAAGWGAGADRDGGGECGEGSDEGEGSECSQ